MKRGIVYYWKTHNVVRHISSLLSSLLSLTNINNDIYTETFARSRKPPPLCIYFILSPSSRSLVFIPRAQKAYISTPMSPKPQANPKGNPQPILCRKKASQNNRAEIYIPNDAWCLGENLLGDRFFFFIRNLLGMDLIVMYLCRAVTWVVYICYPHC